MSSMENQKWCGKPKSIFQNIGIFKQTLPIPLQKHSLFKMDLQLCP